MVHREEREGEVYRAHCQLGQGEAVVHVEADPRTRPYVLARLADHLRGHVDGMDLRDVGLELAGHPAHAAAEVEHDGSRCAESQEACGGLTPAADEALGLVREAGQDVLARARPGAGVPVPLHVPRVEVLGRRRRLPFAHRAPAPRPFEPRMASRERRKVAGEQSRSSRARALSRSALHSPASV